MDFPGLSAKTLTDEELMKKISVLHGRMLMANAYSSNDALNQLSAMLETLMFEQNSRMEKKMFDMAYKTEPKIIESEPDLVEKKVSQESEKKTSRAAVNSIFKRSSTPTSQTE